MNTGRPPLTEEKMALRRSFAQSHAAMQSLGSDPGNLLPGAPISAQTSALPAGEKK